METLKAAKHESRCMDLDLADALDTKRFSAKERRAHLQAAIRRHALIADHLREALTLVERARGVVSMSYPKNLGGGHGPDRLPLSVAQHRRVSMLPSADPSPEETF